jgi:hypothetical protein
MSSIILCLGICGLQIITMETTDRKILKKMAAALLVLLALLPGGFNATEKYFSGRHEIALLAATRQAPPLCIALAVADSVLYIFFRLTSCLCAKWLLEPPTA